MNGKPANPIVAALDIEGKPSEGDHRRAPSEG